MKRVVDAARVMGRLELADRYAAEARQIGQRSALRALLRELRSAEAAGAWFAGDADAAMAILDEVRAEAAGDGDAHRLVVVGRRMAEILEGEGRYEEAVAAGTAALAESVRAGERWSRSEILSHLAASLLRVGRTDEAEARAAEAVAMVRGPEDISGVAEAESARARVLAVRADDHAADAAFSAAIVSADQGEFVSLHISLRLDRAEFLIGRKRAPEAAALLAEVERLAPPPPWNFLPARRRALAAAVEVQRVQRVL